MGTLKERLRFCLCKVERCLLQTVLSLSLMYRGCSGIFVLCFQTIVLCQSSLRLSGPTGSASYGGQSSHRAIKLFCSTVLSGAARRSPFWAKTGAGNGTRTRDLCLGKATLYQLSYSRVYVTTMKIVPRGSFLSIYEAKIVIDYILLNEVVLKIVLLVKNYTSKGHI